MLSLCFAEDEPDIAAEVETSSLAFRLKNCRMSMLLQLRLIAQVNSTKQTFLKTNFEYVIADTLTYAQGLQYDTASLNFCEKSAVRAFCKGTVTVLWYAV